MTASDLLIADDADAIWLGSSAADALGTGLIALEDLDGDGLADVAISAPGTAAAAGRIYIVSGTAELTSGPMESIATATLEGDDLEGEAGTAMAGGDVDGDGTVDLVIGAPMAVTQSGRVHVVGGTSLVAGSWTISDVSLVSYTGPTVFGQAGTVLSSGGDVDGDGLEDLLVGAPADSTVATSSGAAWLIISGLTGPRALADADASFWGGSTSDQTGASVGMADLNGDGLDDLLMGVTGEDTFGDEGAVYIGYSGF